MPAPLLFIVTGGRGAGKTTFCTRMVHAAQEAGWHTAGLITHAVYSGQQRSAIEVEDIATGQVRTLAVRSLDDPTPGTREWKFDPNALAWGNTVLKASIPSDLLVIDELGPLEFERGSGWIDGLAVVDAMQFAIAFIVIRVELLGEALLRWGDANLVEIDTPEDSQEKAQVLSAQLF
jgi:nucleoside-triphosphatase